MKPLLWSLLCFLVLLYVLNLLAPGTPIPPGFMGPPAR